MVQRLPALLLALTLVLGSSLAQAQRTMQIVVLGDSLSAGLGLAEEDAFPGKLARALLKKGHAISIANAGVSGDTASGGLARLDWSVPEGTQAVIVELGANDMLRGIDPAVTKGALDEILRRLERRHIAVLLVGMKSVQNFGPDYAKAFEAIYPTLASTHPVVFYPFFLAGVVGKADLNQMDGLHPNAAGIDVVVARILPQVETLLARVKTGRGS